MYLSLLDVLLLVLVVFLFFDALRVVAYWCAVIFVVWQLLSPTSRLHHIFPDLPKIHFDSRDWNRT